MNSANQTLMESSLAIPVDLLDRLLSVSHSVRVHFNTWLENFDLTDGRYAVLAALAVMNDRGCSQAILAERLRLSESNVSTLIERMQRDGLVSRSKNIVDRRKRVIQITTTGQSMLVSVEANRSAWAARLFQGLRSSERDLLVDLLKRLSTNLDTIPQNLQREFPAAVVIVDSVRGPHGNPSDDPQTPQFALRKMLRAMSSSSKSDSSDKEVA